MNPTGKPGLQVERTQLAWERTAIGFLAVGALVLLRHDELPFPGRSVAAMTAFALTIVVVMIGRLRSAGMLTARATIRGIGCATIGLATVVGLLISLVQP